MYVRLTGTKYPNNSDILITYTGQGEDGGLQCITDLTKCCKVKHTTSRKALGHWFYPNGSVVGLKHADESFHKSRNYSKVYLHRRIDSISPAGKFCCVVPDATYTDITVFVNLGE